MQIILTPNQRMARYLQASMQTAIDAIQASSVLSINQWLENLYKEFVEIKKTRNDLLPYENELPILISNDEEVILWEKIILASEEGEILLKVTPTAKLVQSAFSLCKQWGVMFSENELHSIDAKAYLKWQKAYVDECQKQNWIDFARLPDLILELLQAILKNNDYIAANNFQADELPFRLTFSKNIELVGFDELSPQWVTFFDTLKQYPISIAQRQLIGNLKNVPNISRVKLENSESEYHHAAYKAKQFIARINKEDQRQKAKHRMAIVVLNLNEDRNKIERIFLRWLPKECYNISAPQSLASFPFIKSVLLALKMMRANISREDLSEWLLSPFFGDAQSEMAERAFLDCQLRYTGEPSFSWHAILNIINEHTHNFHLSSLKNIIKNLVAILPELKGKKTTTEWHSIVKKLITLLVWPGERQLNSDEYEMRACFENQLSAYQSYHKLLGKHSFVEAVKCIQEKVNQTVFASQTHPDAPVQILGLLEALGLPFDTLWVCGLHRNAWPEEPRPNPFIPIGLQKKYNLPRSSAARELQVAKRTMDQFIQSANEVILSYPAMLEEEKMFPSALILPFPEINNKTIEFFELSESSALIKPIKVSEIMLNLTNPYLNAKINAVVFNKEVVGPPLHNSEKNLGGSTLLKLQAICPFRSFAEIRLKAIPLPKTSLGLDPKERGIIIHDVLYQFYKNIPDQTALKALSDQDIELILNQTIQEILLSWQKKRPATLTRRYLQLEGERIKALVHKLILLDKERPYFTILDKEIRTTITLSDIQLSIRIDRIDKLESGEEILVDYKTSDIALSQWFSERSEEPQLPLYSITRQNPAVGLIFAVIHPDKMNYKGLIKNTIPFMDVKTIEKFKYSGAEITWEAQHDKWQRSLTQLAKDFASGVATVDPKAKESSCQNCHLKLLCRYKYH